MSEQTARVRVAGAQFRFDREQYTRGDELEVPERIVSRHPRTLEIVEDEDDGSADELPEPADLTADESEADPLPFSPQSYTVDELEERVENVDDPDELRALRNLEEEQKDRETAKDVVDARLNELEG